jgi:nitrogenase-associated protein
MARVVFYEKPGSPGSERQKDLLRRAGHEVEVRDLLRHPWTRAELLAFLGALPVSEWIDRTSPRVKSGEVVPARLSPGEALTLLLDDPGLLRRPLLEVGTRREVGFLAAVIDQWIGLDSLAPGPGARDQPGSGSAGGPGPGPPSPPRPGPGGPGPRKIG